MFLLALAVSTVAFGNGGDSVSPFPISDPQLGKQESTTMAVDSQGNVIITGYSVTTNTNDFYTVKLYSNGTGTAWTATFDKSNSDDRAVAVVIDSNDDVIVTGFVGSGQAVNIQTIKYNGATGAIISQHTWNGGANGADYPTAIAIDSSNNVYVTGYSYVASENEDWVILKYSYNSGDKTLSVDTTFDSDGVVTYGGSANKKDMISSIFVGSDGLVVTGRSSYSASGFDYLTRKYDLNGSYLWERRYSSAGSSYTLAGPYVKIDSSGNIAFTGSILSGANLDIYTAKYNGSDGGIIWQKTYAGDYSDEPRSLWIDSGGDVYVTGYTWTLAGRYEFYTVRYTSAGSGGSGVIVWEQMFGSGGDNDDVTVPTGIVVADSADEYKTGVYVTGFTYKSSTGDYDFQTIKYKKDNGNQLWQTSYDGAMGQDDVPTGIALGPNNSVYVAGWTNKIGTVDSGIASGESTTVLVKDTTAKGWPANRWSNYHVKITSGANANLERNILGNTGDTLLISGSDPFPSSTAGATYEIYDPEDYDYVVIKYDQGLLNAPTNLTAEATTSTSVVLTWTDNSLNEDGFRIERKLCTDATYTVINSISSNSTNTVTYSDSSDVSPDTKYCYQVRAYNAANGNTHPSNEAHALTTIVPMLPPTWSSTYDGGVGHDYATAIAVGPDNNPVVTGYSLFTENSYDYYTVKFNRQNGSVIWSALYDGDQSGGHDQADAVAVDSNNEAIVSGYSYLFDVPSGKTTNDIKTIKYYSSQQNPQDKWAKVYNGPTANDDYSVSVASAVDGSDNIVVVGYGMNAEVNGNTDIYVVKYSSSGTLLWQAAPYDRSGGSDVPSAVALDASGNIFITGYTCDAANTDCDIVTRKYNGSNGSVIWTDIYPDDHTGVTDYGIDEAKAISIDSSGDVYMTGYTTNASGNGDMFTIKYYGADSANPRTPWSGVGRSFDGEAHGDDSGVSIKIDPIDGRIVTAGTTLTTTGNRDYRLIWYLPATGTVDTQKTLYRDEDDTVAAMSIDISGNVCIAGTTMNSTYDMMSIKYNYEGTIIGATTYNGEANGEDRASAVTINSLGEAFVAGSSENSSGNFDYAVFKCAWDPLQAPAPVTATPYYTSVTLNWLDNSTGNDGYRAERRNDACSSSNTNLWSSVASCSVSGTATTCTDSGLSMNTTYCYRVQAYKTNGETSRWIEKTVTTQIPAAPTGLTASAMNTTQVKLTWTDNTDPESGFTIKRCDAISGCTTTVISGITGTGARTYTDSNVCSNMTYTYSVKATSSDGWETAESIDARAITPSIGNMTADFDFENASTGWGTTSGSTSKMSFDNAYYMTGATSFKISPNGANESLGRSQSVSVIPGDYVLSGWIKASLTAGQVQCDVYSSSPLFDHTGIRIVNNDANDTNQWVYLTTNVNITSGISTVSVRCFSDGSANGTAYFDMIQLVPATPVSLTAVRYSEAQVNLTWTGGTYGDESGFRIMRCVQSGCTPTNVVYTESANASSRNDTGRNNDTLYGYKVQMYKTAAGCSGGEWTSDSPVSYATTTLVAPSGMYASAVNTTQVKLTWMDNTGTETNFNVDRCDADATDCTGAYAPLTSQTGNSSIGVVYTYSGNDTTVCPTMNYKYRVKATNSSWTPQSTDYAYSNVVTTPTPTAPSLTVTKISEVQARLTWTDTNSDRSGFKILRCEVSGCTPTLVVATPLSTDTSYDDNNRTPNTTYRYKLLTYKTTASCAGGEWTAGSEVKEVITTPDPPAGLSSSVISSTQINLSWTTDKTASETGFQIERCSGSSCDFSSVDTLGTIANTLTYSDTSACSSTYYRYRAKAVKESLFKVSGGRSWTRRAPLTINPWQANFQVKMVINYDSDMQPDFDDIRFRDLDNNLELPYWIESKVDGIYATVWLKTGSSSNIYLYYGNPGAGSVSDGNAVFELYDDFSGSSIDAAKWITGGSSGTAFSQSGGMLTGGSTYRYIQSVNAFTGQYIAETRVYETSNSSYGFMTLGFYSSSGNGIGILTYGSSYYYRNDSSWSSSYSYTSTGKWVRDKITAIGANSVVSRTREDTGVTDTRTFNNGGLSSEYLRLSPRYDDNYNYYNYSATWDWIRVRKYAATEPAVTLNAEESGSYGSTVAWASGPGNETPAQQTPTPLAPSGVTATALSESQITLTWVDNTTTALKTQETGFKIERKAEACGLSALTFKAIVPLDDAFSSGVDSDIWMQRGRVYNGSGTLVEEQASAPINIVNANGNSSINTGSDVTLHTTSPGGGNAGVYNDTRLYLKSPAVISGDFDTQIDYSIPPTSNYTQTQVPARLQIFFPNSGGNSNYAYVERRVSGGAHAYYADAVVSGTSNTAILATSDMSGTLRIKRTGSTIYAYVKAAGLWTLLKEVTSGPTTTATDLSVVQMAQRNESSDLTATLDNFKLDVSNADATSLVDSNLSYDVTYCYRVSARKSAICPWEVQSSNNDDATTISPPAPSNLKATAVSSTQINLSWSDNTGTETAFRVQRCEVGNDCPTYSDITTLAKDTTSHPDTGVCQGKTYRYKVVAEPWGVESNVAVAVTPTVSNMLLDSDFENSSTSWTVAPNGGSLSGTFDTSTYYSGSKSMKVTGSGSKVGRAQTVSVLPGNYTLSGNIKTNLTGGLARCNVYGTGVNTTGITSSGVSDWISTDESVVVPAGTSSVNIQCFVENSPQGDAYFDFIQLVPIIPVSLTATRYSESQVNLTWTGASYNDETGFRILRCEQSGCTPTSIAYTEGQDISSKSDTGRSINILYRYKVQIYKTAAGCSGGEWNADSPISEATTTLTAPSSLTASVVEATRVKLTWTDNTGLESAFNRYRCTQNGPITCETDTHFTTVLSQETGTNTIGSTITSYDDTACKSTTYRYMINAVRTSPTWTTGNTYSNFITTPTPSAPTGLSATRISETQINFSWNDNTSGTTEETGFKIERCVDGPTSNCTEDTYSGSSTGTGVRTYQHSNLDPLTTYYYRVKAYKTVASGCSWDTDYISVTQKNAYTSVTAPSGLSAAASSTTTVALTWNDNTVSEDRFRINRCEGSTCDPENNPTYSFTTSSGSSSTKSATDDAACKATTYRYTVRAENDPTPKDYDSSWSQPYYTVATPDATMPDNLNVSAISDTEVTMSWTDMTSDESGFKIQRCLKDTGVDCTLDAHFTNIPSVGAGITTTNDSSLLPSREYCYRVAAYKTAGASECNWTTNYIMPADCAGTFPAIPTSLTATAISSMKVLLSWSDDSSDETGFEIEVQIWNGKWVKTAEVGPNVESFIDTIGLEPSKQYKYRVRSVRDSGKSPYSNEATVNYIQDGTTYYTTKPYTSGDNTCEYVLMITVSGSGSVSPSPGGISCGTNCYAYTVGAEVLLTAKPGTSVTPTPTFTGWSGSCSGNSTICTITMDGDKAVTATFSP